MANALKQGEQRRIQKCIASRVYKLCSDRENHPEYFKEIYHDLKVRYSVSSYKEIPSNQILSVIRYVESWEPKTTFQQIM